MLHLALGSAVSRLAALAVALALTGAPSALVRREGGGGDEHRGCACSKRHGAEARCACPSCRQHRGAGQGTARLCAGRSCSAPEARVQEPTGLEPFTLPAALVWPAGGEERRRGEDERTPLAPVRQPEIPPPRSC